MEKLLIYVVCLLMSIIALAVSVWVVISGQIQRQGLDSLFLVIVCLLVLVIFLPTPVLALRKGALRDLLQAKKTKAAGETQKAAPIAQQKSEQSS